MVPRQVSTVDTVNRHRTEGVESPVENGRVARVWATIRQHAERDGEPPSLRHVCSACAAAVSARGAGLSVNRGHGVQEPVCAVGPADELEELQFTLGEGPSVEAFAREAPVLVADLSSARTNRRWPMFAPAAHERGVRAVFSFPLQAGIVRAGVLTIYREVDGFLSTVELADSLVYADAAMLLVLNRGKQLASDTEHQVSDGYDERRAEVHQAAGMISVQLGIGVEDALVRLRAHAYAENRRLADVARDVVARRLRFTRERADNPDSEGPDPEREAPA